MAAPKKVTLAMLKSVAEDFNSFMFAEGEGIKLNLKQAALQKEIVESAGELAEDDVITAETAETLALLNLKHEAQIADADPEEEAVEVDEPDADPEEEELEEPDAEEVPDAEEEDEAEPEDPAVVKALLADVKKAKNADAVKAIAKARGIRIPPPFLKDLAKLKTYVTGKLDGSSAAAAKPEKKEKKDSGPSNKRVVYDSWNKGKGETDPEKLSSIIEGRVKKTTIVSWLRQWGNEKNLPAGVK